MKSTILKTLTATIGMLGIGGCNASGIATEDTKDLPNSFAYDVSTDEFEDITTSFASQWYPSEANRDVEHMIWFRCMIEPYNQKLDLFIENVKSSDENFVSSGDPFNDVRIKFDDGAPVQVFDDLSIDRLRVDFATLQNVGELKDAKIMSIRVDNAGYVNENSDFTVSVNMKNKAIQNVFNDCKNVLDRAK